MSYNKKDNNYYFDFDNEAYKSTSNEELITKTINTNVVSFEPNLKQTDTQTDFLVDLINPKFSFEHLHISDFNSSVFLAAKQLIENKNFIYNPFIITAETNGLGRSHFAQAIALEFKKKTDLNVIYTRAETFVQEFVTMLKLNTIEKFKYKYRKQTDVLIIDDIDFLEGKLKTQTELIFIFEDFINSNKKLILTSSRPIKELKDFDPRLKSRLSSGLITILRKPLNHEMEAIIIKKAASLNIPLNIEMIKAIAKASNNNLIEIEGILVKILAKHTLEKKKITLELIHELTAEKLINSLTKINIEVIESIVCKNYGIKKEELNVRSRKQHIADIRMLIMYLAKKYTELTQSEIGAYYDKNHNTISHAFDKIASKIASSPIYALQVEHIENQIKDFIFKGKGITI